MLAIIQYFALKSSLEAGEALITFFSDFALQRGVAVVLFSAAKIFPASNKRSTERERYLNMFVS